ncbi:unnamed protein product [Candida verbasci]|uniref:Uncharacterized protein n=1 Tax=Candida verbasci TaxID=1227364 RepID=A0A9W4U1U2_9ASCO|nr:unnamed protein product [Candida verbasci]
MRKTKLPKLSKKIQSKIEDKDVSELDFLEQGSIDEESGDRWLGSDIAKSLRFYQKAYNNYLKSIETDYNIDAYYNSSRLLFQIYNLLKTDGLKLKDLNNIDEIFGSNSIIQPLDQILKAHEDAIKQAKTQGAQPSPDLLFNFAVVYNEFIDVQGDSTDLTNLFNVFSLAAEIFETLLASQLNELEKFADELQNIDNSTVFSGNRNANGGNKRQEELVSAEVVQPTDLCETVLASYKLMSSMYDADFATPQNLQSIADLISPLMYYTDDIVEKLLEKYSYKSHISDMLDNITKVQHDEIHILRISIMGSYHTDLEFMMKHWQVIGLPETPERYMTASDNIQAYLDRNEINLDKVNKSANEDKEIYWRCLTFQNTELKKAQELLNGQLKIKRKSPDGTELGIGSLISQISEVIIARADIELTRSLMDYEPAIKNKNVLFNNAKVFLKSAMNIANTSGGLREKITEKLSREQRKTESALRLCYLENKYTPEELNEIMGSTSRWEDELPNLRKVGLYNRGILTTTSKYEAVAHASGHDL